MRLAGSLVVEQPTHFAYNESQLKTTRVSYMHSQQCRLASLNGRVRNNRVPIHFVCPLNK